MEDLIMKNINCPGCNHPIEYWTKNSFIECIKCKNMIEVEPCVVVKRLTVDDLLEKGIIFADEVWTEEGDYWLEYYEDENCTKEIEDIDEFIRSYNEVADE